MPHDPGLDELFDAVRLIDAPVAAMVAESHRLGLRLRRRRRLRIAGAALAVAALATVATPGLWPTGRGDLPATVAAPPPAAAPDTGTTDPEPTAPLSREAMFVVLSRMLPSDSTAVLLPPDPTAAVARTRWRPADGYYEIGVRIRDGGGSADLRIALSRMSNEHYDCRDAQGCSNRLLPSGERQLVEKFGDSRKDLLVLSVRRERLDGMAVTIVTTNARNDPDGTPVGSRTALPYSPDLLWTWTGAQEWQELVPRRLTEGTRAAG